MGKLPLKRLLDMQQLALDFRAMDRIVYVPENEGHRAENNVEHTFSLAMLAWQIASQHPHLNIDKVIRYSLVHDIVEIHAGDILFHRSAKAEADKHARETAALKRLKQDWPDFPDLAETIRIYEARQDNESKFVYALDKLQPLLVIYLTNGYTWHVTDIDLKMLHEGKDHKVAISKDVEPYYKELMGILHKQPELFGEH